MQLKVQLHVSEITDRVWHFSVAFTLALTGTRYTGTYCFRGYQLTSTSYLINLAFTFK